MGHNACDFRGVISEDEAAIINGATVSQTQALSKNLLPDSCANSYVSVIN